MTKSTVALRFFFFLAYASVNSAAHALDNDQEGPPEEISAALRAEGQKLVAHANLMKEDGRLLAMFFTTNASKSIGYIIQSDKPYGDKGSVFSVYRRMAEIRIFDARVSTPESVFLKAQDSVALARCKQLEDSSALPKHNCIPYNKTLRNAEGRGQRPMIQGYSVKKNSEGQYVPNGTLITVTGNMGKAIERNATTGIISSMYYSSLPDGATILNATLTYAEYEPYGFALLGSSK